MFGRFSSLLGILAAAAAISVRPPFQSARAPGKTVFNYELVEPLVTSQDGGEGPYPSQMTVQLVSVSRSFTLHLELSTDLLSEDFQSVFYDEDGNEIVTHGLVNCFYAGSVEGHSGWVAIISTCRGLRGSFGNPEDLREEYEVEPFNHNDTSLDQLHVLYLASEIEESKTLSDIELTSLEILRNATDGPVGERVRRADEPAYVELHIINDHRMYVRQGRDVDSVREKTLEIVNHMKMLYRPLNVQIVLKEVIVWSNGNQFDVSENGETTVERLAGYTADLFRRTGNSKDSILMFTGNNLYSLDSRGRRSNGLAGIAFLGSACGLFPVGVVEGYYANEVITNVAAHELGHILDMYHDGGSCSCEDTAGYCIMAPSFNSFRLPTKWSTCSRNDLNRFLSRTRSRCLDRPVQDCSSGFTRSTTSGSCVDINECSSSNGGCDQTCTNTAGSFQCDCRNGFRLGGNERSCNDINECSSSNGGCDQICTNTAGSFQCDCRNGFQLGGNRRSCNDINECSSNNGGCDQICTNTAGSFHCSCRAGYQLGGNRRSCDDINECVSNGFLGGCSWACFNTEGSFTCHCQPGLRLRDDGRTCEDINECSSSNGGCDQTCTNTAGSFQCSCETGFELGEDGRSCIALTLCALNNGDCDQICTATGAEGDSFLCSCRPGYQLEGDGTSCADINECSNNNGSCDHTCTNTVGSFQCSCETGYQLGVDGISCNDINECSSSNGGCDQICTNTVGSFQCDCRSGYQLGGDGISCNDINECSSNNGGCEETCTNTAGSFQCGCRSGYQLGVDEISCNDINECSSSNGGCDQTCTNTAGSFQCSCRSGYQLGGDERSCNDINECSSSNGGCEQTCTNTAGSFQCACRNGFQLGGNSSCNDINECSSNNGGCDQTCTNTAGSFQCSCRSGYQLGVNRRSCNDINECSSNNGGCEKTCTNTVGSFQCSCVTGFQLAGDGISCIDLNECLLDNGGCGDDEGCVNTDGSFSCTGCSEGHYRAADGSCTNQCGGLLTGNSGSLQSPGWPEFYPVNTSCEWTIDLADSSRAIQLSFDRVYGLAGRTPCPRDSVEIFDVGSDSSLGRFCFKRRPSTVTTSGDVARIVFRSGTHHYNTRRGFRITYQAVDRQ